MRTGDLTTLERVKGWLNTGPTSFPPQDDALLSRLITAASAWAQTYMSRKIPPSDYSITFNGPGTPTIFLPNQPVIAVSAVSVDGLVITRQTNPPLSGGYAFDARQVYYVGGCFPRGFQNVSISYSAGFQVADEAAVVTDDALVLSSLSKLWNKDVGVTLADGTELVAVTGAPGDGEYQLDTSTEPFKYKFNAAQAGEDILVTYGYTPEDIDQVVVELVGERYKARTRVGQTSVNLGNGQVVSFTNKDVNDNSKMVLDNYSLKALLP